MSEDKGGRPSGIKGATDEVLDRMRALGDSVRSTAGSALGAGQEVPVFGDLMSSMQRLVEQAPTPTAQVDMFLEELRAKRALVVAFQAQLTSLDHQMEILQRSLQPVAEWGRQWSRLQDGFADGLRVLTDSDGALSGDDQDGSEDTSTSEGTSKGKGGQTSDEA